MQESAEGIVGKETSQDPEEWGDLEDSHSEGLNGKERQVGVVSYG